MKQAENKKDLEVQDLVIVLMPEEQKTDFKDFLGGRVLWLFLILVSILFTFVTAFQIQVSKGLISLWAALCTAVFSWIFLKSKLKKYWLAALFILYSSASAIFYKTITTGFYFVLQKQDKNITIPKHFMEAHYGEQYATTIFLLFCLFMLAMILGYGILYRLNLFLVLIIAVPIAEMIVYWHKMPSYISFVLFVIVLLAVFIMHQSLESPKSTRQTLFHDVRAYNKLLASSSNLALGIAFCVGVFLVLGGLLMPAKAYKDFREKNTFAQQTEKFFSNYLDGVFTNTFFGNAEGGIAAGNLGKVNAFKFTNEKKLKVTLDNIKSSVYLRGFIGSDYTGSSWEDMPKEYAEEYKTLEKVMNQQAWQLPITAADYDQKLFSPVFHGELKTISIEQIKKMKNLAFVPYNMMYTKSSGLQSAANGESIFESKGRSDYDAKFFGIINYDNNIFLWDREQIRTAWLNALGGSGLTQKEIEQYFEAEKKYAAFVEKVYTRLPEKLPQRLYDDFGSLKGSYKNKEALIKTVTGKLSAMADYTLSAGKLPKDKDFVEYFLYENKKGYCNHFATAAVLIFRMAGIPARYVEGYVATTKNYTTAAYEKGQYTFELSDSDSHAWAEIYLDGFGWVPVEVTPGFTVQKAENPDETAGRLAEYEKNIQEETNNLAVETPVVKNIAEDSQSKNARESNEEKKENTAAPFKNKLDYSWLIAVTVLILLLAAFIILRRTLIIEARARSFNGGDINKSVLCIYGHLRNLFKTMKIEETDIISDLEYAKEIEKKCSLIEQGTLISLTKIYLKAFYSREGVSEEEYKNVFDFARRFETKKYASLSLWEKVLSKYIYVFYT